MLTPHYIHLKPTLSPQDLDIESPFAAVVVIDLAVDSEWRHKVSEWLVDQGCLYMMAHGDGCSLWDDSVDLANLEALDWNYDEIPEHKLVTTTWHENETLDDVFFFAKNCALPFSPLIKNIIILDITENYREQDMLLWYEEANQGDVIEKTDYLDLYG